MIDISEVTNAQILVQQPVPLEEDLKCVLFPSIRGFYDDVVNGRLCAGTGEGAEYIEEPATRLRRILTIGCGDERRERTLGRVESGSDSLDGGLKREQ